MYAFVGISLWSFMKKHPNESRGLLSRATDIIKYVPIDSEAKDLLTPIFDFTNVNNKLTSYQENFQSNTVQTPQMNRMMGSYARMNNCMALGSPCLTPDAIKIRWNNMKTTSLFSRPA